MLTKKLLRIVSITTHNRYDIADTTINTGNPRKSYLKVQEVSYICGSCGEEIVIPVDYSAGAEQEYVEDCPVCCHANLITLSIDPSGEVRIDAELE